MLKVPENAIETPASYNWIEDGILFSKAKEKEFLDIQKAKAITKAFLELSDRAMPLFVDLNTTAGQSSETRNYFAKDPDHLKTFSAVALYVSNPVAKVVANIYMGLVKPDKPTRMFTDSSKALDWLNSYK